MRVAPSSCGFFTEAARCGSCGLSASSHRPPVAPAARLLPPLGDGPVTPGRMPACLSGCPSVCRRLQPVNQSGGRGSGGGTRTVPATLIEDPEWAERVTPPFGPSPRPAATRRSQRARPQPRVTPNSIQKKAKFTSLTRSLLAYSKEANILGRINKILNPACLKANEYL